MSIDRSDSAEMWTRELTVMIDRTGLEDGKIWRRGSSVDLSIWMQ